MKDKTNDRYVPALSFGFLTPLYDSVVKLTSREKAFKAELLRRVNLTPGSRALDLGCGTGTLTIDLKRSNPEAQIFGLDGDPKILSFAREKARAAHAEIVFNEGMSYQLPYEDGYFDQTVSSLFFHHLTPENKRKTLAEILRVLKPGGSLHVADWGKADNFLMKILSLPIRLLDGKTTTDSFAGQLPELMREAGFGNVTETANFNSMFGTIRLHTAQKSVTNDAGNIFEN